MKAWSNNETPNNDGYVPERRLLVAVLQRAVTDYVSGDGEIQNESYNWLMNDNNEGDDERPLTFRFICEALDFNVDSLRYAIKVHAQTQGATPLLKMAV